MQIPPTYPAELRLPAAALLHLRRVLGERSGEPAAVHLLHDAGFATGAAVYDQFIQSLDSEPAQLEAERFWEILDDFLSRQGWGDIRHERVHSGLAVLRASDWSESDPAAAEDCPSCAFSAGVLAHLLGRVARGPVAVLEVSCRSRGDDECVFLFGSEEAVQRAYTSMEEGASLDQALSHV